MACPACIYNHRRCTQDCVFAPYFPPTDPQKYISVHRVYGASNVSKFLNDLPPHQRQDAVNCLVYEAKARIRDPVRGCVGLISSLQEDLKKVQQDLVTTKEELAGYMGPDATMSTAAAGSVTGTGFDQMDVNGDGAGGSLSGLSLSLGIGDAYQMGQETDAANGQENLHEEDEEEELEPLVKRRKSSN